MSEHVGVLLVALQCLWSALAGVAVGYLWHLRRDADRHLADARRLHEETTAMLATIEQRVASARRAGVDLDAVALDA
jgi:hypothetical protein